MISKTPIAWLQLTFQKSRLLVTLLGIVFAVFLMFMQLGFRDGLFEDSITIHKTLQADLVLLHVDTQNFFAMKAFSRRRLYDISAIEGVESVNPFYFASADFKNPETFTTKRIAICAFNPARPVFNLAEVNQQLEIIQQDNTVLFDRLSRREYGAIASEFAKKGVVTTELANRRIRIGGLFSLGGGVLSSDGFLITSDLNFASLLDQRLEAVPLGLINVQPGIEPESIVKNISTQLPKDVKLLTMQQFMDLQKNFVAKATPIGFIFNLGTVIGCVFGGTIVYQILYTQISDNLYIYATLKAIGYASVYLVGTVLQQAVLLSLMGYMPGLILSLYLYNLVEDGTRLPMFMTFMRGAIVLILTIVMCSFASLLAMSRLRSADPADLFQ